MHLENGLWFLESAKGFSREQKHAPGSLRIKVSGDSLYAVQWYTGRPDVLSATDVAVAAGAPTTVVNATHRRETRLGLPARGCRGSGVALPRRATLAQHRGRSGVMFDFRPVDDM